MLRCSVWMGWMLVLAAGMLHGQKYGFRTYTTADGLIPFAAERIHQDHLGNLWITTAGGLMRYDGKSFRSFTTDEGLGSNVLRAITEDAHHTLWIGSLDGGLIRIRREDTGEYDLVTYTTSKGLPHNAVLSVAAAKDGHLWIGTKNGIARLEVDAAGGLTGVKAFLPGIVVDQIVCLEDGTVVCGENGGRVYWSRGDSFEFLQVFSTEAAGINGLQPDRSGNVWISTFQGGVKKLRRTAAGFVGAGQALAADPKNPVYHLAVDASDRVWVSTFGRGLLCLDGYSTRTYDRRNGVPENNLVCSFVDRERNLWISTANSGLCKLVDHPFSFYDQTTGLAGDFVLDLLQDRSGSYWFSSYEGGLSRYDGKTFIPVTAKNGLPTRKTYALMEDSRGQIWVSTMGEGVYVSEGARFRPFFKNSHLLTDVLVMFEDRERNIWFGTDVHGAVRYSPQGQWAQFGTEQGLAGQRVFSITQDRKGRIWFGCGQPSRMKEAGGLSYWDPERYLKNLNPFITYSAVKKDFPSNHVNVVYFDREGTLWAGTRHNGLLKYDQGNWIAYTRKEGLAANTVMSLQEDSSGRLWIGTTKGITIRDGEAFATLTTRHGLINDEVYENAVWCDRRGDMWFGTAGGACRFDVRRLMASQMRPTVHVERLRSRGQTLSMEGLADLTHDQNALDVEVTGIQLKAEKELAYQYFLEGFDAAWPDRTARDFVSYTNLDPGSYVLRIRAWSLLSGLASEEVAVEFTIHPAFWQTWWFRILVLLGVAVAAPVVYRRGRKAYEQFQQWRRTRVVAHYRIREFIGEGGMGRVYKAWDTRHRRFVALKVIREDLEQSTDGVKRFLKEAEIGQTLHHPNIVSVFDAGSYEKSRYLAMEFVEGITLKAYIRERGRVEIPEALTIAQQILSGVQTIHAHFVVHRDLKSDNILLQRDGVAKIMDFGLAKLRMLSSIMDRGKLVGTLAYMSPEQTIGKSVDHRCDIYAVGVILYEMAYGEMPFTGQNEMELIMAIHNETPPHIASPYLAGLERIIAKAMNKDPQARYQTALEMIAELDALDKTLDKPSKTRKKS